MATEGYNPRQGTVGIIGAGPAGLITAYTLLRDGFSVQLLTRDKTPGGVWAEERLYPGLVINSVYGEFKFSPLEMPKTGSRLTGEDIRAYINSFAENFLKDHIRYNTEVIEVKRDHESKGWVVEVEDRGKNVREVLKYTKIVLCTGGCSAPRIPDSLSPAAAKLSLFKGPVLHSSQFREHLADILAHVQPNATAPELSPTRRVVIVGGGKSALDIAAYLANEGRQVTVVFDSTGAALATPSPLPDFIRRSRFLSILAGHIELRTRLERFLHTTWIGSKITHFIWNAILWGSNDTLKIPKASPLRTQVEPGFWSARVSDEGTYRENGFYALVNAGKIDMVAPARVTGYGADGRSVTLNNGKTIEADAVVLATGFTSSWRSIFSKETMEELGLSIHTPSMHVNEWKDYASLANPPPSHSNSEYGEPAIYRGLVPAKNINRRDFAINGAIFTTNNGYSFEVFSHWISSYFLNDKMRLPATPADALAACERNTAWKRKRFPDMSLSANESFSSGLAVHSWPQVVDEMLEDMELPSMRSGGNWFTWPFKVVDTKEIATLKEERDAKRQRGSPEQLKR